MFENVFEKCHSVLLLQIRPYDNQKALLDHYFSSKTVAVGGKKNCIPSASHIFIQFSYLQWSSPLRLNDVKLFF